MVMRAVTLVAIIAVASAASIGQQRCCGPAEWEAMAVASAAYGYSTAQARSMSGSMTVDHNKQLMALYLMSMTNSTNATMMISANNSMLYVYFMMNQMNQDSNTQPACTAYVMKHVVADLSSSCFPEKQSNVLLASLGQQSGTLAYEFAGLGGLINLQILANAKDCTPASFAMSPAVANGPLMKVMLSNINPSASDRSMSGAPAQCDNVMPVEILMPNGGMFGSRQGSMEQVSRKQSRNGDQQWIDDLVTVYLMEMMRPHASPRHRRDATAAGGLLVHESDKPTTAQIIQSAQALRQMLQAYSNFIGPESENQNEQTPTNSRRPSNVNNPLDLISAISQDSPDLKNLIERIVKENLVSVLTPDSHDLQDLVAKSIKQNLLSGLTSDNRDLQDLVARMIKQNLLADLTSDNRDLQDLVARMIKQNLLADSTANSHDSRDIIANLLKKQLMSSVTEERNPHDALQSLIGAMERMNIISGMRSGEVDPKDVIDMMVKMNMLSGMTSGHMDPKDLLAAMEKMNIISGMRSGEVDPKDVIDMMVKMNMLSGMTSGHMDPKDLLAAMEKMNIISGMRSGEVDPKDVIDMMVKMNMLSGMTSGHMDAESSMEMLGKMSLLADLQSGEINAKDVIEAMKKLSIGSDALSGKH